LRILIGELKVIDSSSLGTVATPLNKRLDSGPFSFKTGLDRSIRTIPDPPSQAMAFCGLHRLSPKKDALDTAMNTNMGTDFIR
jgi:hypothetical protein